MIADIELIVNHHIEAYWIRTSKAMLLSGVSALRCRLTRCFNMAPPLTTACSSHIAIGLFKLGCRTVGTRAELLLTALYYTTIIAELELIVNR